MNEEKVEEKPKHPGGRPTKYTESMPDRLKDYVDRGYKGDGDVIPTKAGFAVLAEVCEKTLDNWGAEYPEFLQMLRYLMAKQHQILQNKGLIGDFNSLICKLLLSSDHGHREGTDLTTKGEKITPQIVSFADAVKGDREKKEDAGTDS